MYLNEQKPTAHCTHLQIAQTNPHPKFVKECNHPRPLRFRMRFRYL
jgi:hypothetical protein